MRYLEAKSIHAFTWVCASHTTLPVIACASCRCDRLRGCGRSCDHESQSNRSEAPAASVPSSPRIWRSRPNVISSNFIVRTSLMRHIPHKQIELTALNHMDIVSFRLESSRRNVSIFDNMCKDISDARMGMRLRFFNFERPFITWLMIAALEDSHSPPWSPQPSVRSSIRHEFDHLEPFRL